jgi:hypothetical protein
MAARGGTAVITDHGDKNNAGRDQRSRLQKIVAAIARRDVINENG